LCLVCLLSLPGYCYEEYDGPELPDGWLPIHLTELQRLDEIMLQQETQLTTVEGKLEMSETVLLRQEQSLQESEREQRRLRFQRNVAISVAGVMTVAAIVCMFWP